MRRKFQDGIIFRLWHGYCLLFLDLRWKGAERYKTMKSDKERSLSEFKVGMDWVAIIVKNSKAIKGNLQL